MSIIIKNSKLNQQTIESLNTLLDIEMNALIAFKLSKIIKEILSLYDDKIKMEKRIYDKWYKRDETGQIVEEITDKDKFSIEMNSFMSIDNEIQFEKIRFEDMGLKTARVKDIIELEFLFY
jgi:hypothetical protein